MQNLNNYLYIPYYFYKMEMENRKNISRVRLTICVEENNDKQQLKLIGYIKTDPIYKDYWQFSPNKNFKDRILILEKFDQKRFLVVQNDGSEPSVGSVCKMEMLEDIRKVKLTICLNKNDDKQQLKLIGYIQPDPFEADEFRFSQDKNFKKKVFVIEKQGEKHFIVVQNDGDQPAIGSVCKMEDIIEDTTEKNINKDPSNPSIYKKFKF